VALRQPPLSSLLEILQASWSELSTFQPTQLEAVPDPIVVAGQVTVTVVTRTAKQQQQRRRVLQLGQALADLLHNALLAPGCVVYLSDSPLAALYNIDRVYVHECCSSTNGPQQSVEDAAACCWTVDRRATRVSVRQQVSATYVESLQGAASCRLAGVDASYAACRSAVRQRQEHLLLMGPVGVGKASLVRAVAAELRLPLIAADCGELLADNSGGGSDEGGHSTATLTGLFATAGQVAGESLDADSDDGGGAILLLENVESLGGRGGQAVRLGRLLESSRRPPGRSGGGHLTVICTTSRPEELDPTIRRPGRLGIEITIKVTISFSV